MNPIASCLLTGLLCGGLFGPVQAQDLKARIADQVADRLQTAFPGGGTVAIGLFPILNISDQLGGAFRGPDPKQFSTGISTVLLRAFQERLLEQRGFEVVLDDALAQRVRQNNRSPTTYDAKDGEVLRGLAARAGLDAAVWGRIELTNKGHTLTINVQLAADGAASIAPITVPLMGADGRELFGDLRAALANPVPGFGDQAPPASPNVDVEIEWGLDRIATSLRHHVERLDQAPSGRVAVVVTWGDKGDTNRLCNDVRQRLADSFRDAGYEVQEPEDFEANALKPLGRNLHLLTDVVSSNAELSYAKVLWATNGYRGLVVVKLTRGGSGVVNLSPTICWFPPDGRDFCCLTPRLDRLAVGSGIDPQFEKDYHKRIDGLLRDDQRPLSAVAAETDAKDQGRNEIFQVCCRAARSLFLDPAVVALLQADPVAKVSIGTIRTPAQRATRAIENEFAARCFEREQSLRQRLQGELEGDGLEQAVLDHPETLEIAGHLYASLRQAQAGLRALALDILTNSMTSDFEKDLQQLLMATLDDQGLVPAGRWTLRGEDTAELRQQRRDYIRELTLNGGGGQLPAQTALGFPRLVLNIEFIFTGIDLRASLQLVDTAKGMLAMESAKALSKLAKAAQAAVRTEVKERAAAKLPDPLQGQPVAVSPNESGEKLSTPVEMPAADRETFLESRTGCVAMVIRDPRNPQGLNYWIERVGTCFAIELDGKAVLATNRHVVTDEEGGRWSLSHENTRLKSLEARWFVYLFVDGETRGFETEVLGFSRDCDLALLRDPRPGKAPVFARGTIGKGDRLFSCGYPGYPTRVRGLGNQVEIGSDQQGKPKTVFTVVTSDPGNPQGLIDSYFTEGVVSAFDPPVKGEARGRRLWFTNRAWPGNSGGPLLNEKGEVVGVLTWGGRGNVVNENTAHDQMAGGQLLDEDAMAALRQLVK